MVQQFYVRYHYHEHHFTVLSIIDEIMNLIISFSYTNNTRYNSFGNCAVLLYSPTLKRFHADSARPIWAHHLSHLGPAHLVPSIEPVPFGPCISAHPDWVRPVWAHGC